MKKLVTTGIALVMALMLPFSAYAMEVPTGTVIQNLNGVQQYIKTYTVSAGTDPQELIEEPFDYEGFTYRYASITKVENEFDDEKQQTETVTVETDKKDLSVVLDALPVSVEYDDGQYVGTLYLDHSTIETVASGHTTKSYTVSTTKEYGNLDSNDMAYVPATTVKDGKTLPLVNVEWVIQGSALVDDVLVPSAYKAVATYADKAYYSAATGYVTTANYIGSVSCSEIESVTYTVTYVGEPEARLTANREITPDDGAQDHNSLIATGVWLYVVAGLLIVAVVTAAICFLRSDKGKQFVSKRGTSRKE